MQHACSVTWATMRKVGCILHLSAKKEGAEGGYFFLSSSSCISRRVLESLKVGVHRSAAFAMEILIWNRCGWSMSNRVLFGETCSGDKAQADNACR